MNRKEQIRNASKECMVKSYASKFENYIKQSAFISGAKWADKHPVSPWIPLDGKHKEPPYKRTIAVYYPLGGGRVELVERKVSGIPYGKPTNKSVILEEYKAPEKPQDFTLHIDYTDSLPHDNIIPIKYIPSWLKTTNKNNKK